MPSSSSSSTRRFVRDAAIYRGLLGGSRPWLAVFGLFAIGRARRAVFERTSVTVAREVLLPGEALTITPIGARPTRRERRRARELARSSD